MVKELTFGGYYVWACARACQCDVSCQQTQSFSIHFVFFLTALLLFLDLTLMDYFVYSALWLLCAHCGVYCLCIPRIVCTCVKFLSCWLDSARFPWVAVIDTIWAPALRLEALVSTVPLIGGLLPQRWYLGLILFSFFCHKQPVFKVWLICHWCQKTAQAREGTVPPQTFVPWWHPPSKPFSAWLKSWRCGPLPVAVPAAAHNPSSKENWTWIIRFWWWGEMVPKRRKITPQEQDSASPGQTLPPPTGTDMGQPVDSESDSELWSKVDSTLPQMQESLVRPINTKVAKRLQTLWDVTVPYSAKKQLHEDYAKTPSNLPLFLVPQLPKELSLKLIKSKRKEDEKLMHCQ